MMQPVVRNGILQCARQDFLAGYVFEFLRAPLARDYLVGHKKVMSDESLSDEMKK